MPVLVSEKTCDPLIAMSVDASSDIASANSVKSRRSSSISQLAPEPDTVMSPLSPSEMPPDASPDGPRGPVSAVTVTVVDSTAASPGTGSEMVTVVVSVLTSG